MPTPPLPVLRALLSSLGLEIPVPALRTCTPSLLLLVFERLAARRLTLGEGVRRPASTDAEVELARAVLSALGAAIGADLSVVDCRALAKGAEGELAAAVMALAVLARRIGVVLDLDEGSVTSRKSRASDSSRSASALRSRSLLDEHDEHVPVRPLDPDMFITPPRYVHSAPQPVSHSSYGVITPDTEPVSFIEGPRSPSPVKGENTLLGLGHPVPAAAMQSRTRSYSSQSGSSTHSGPAYAARIAAMSRPAPSSGITCKPHSQAASISATARQVQRQRASSDARAYPSAKTRPERAWSAGSGTLLGDIVDQLGLPVR